MHLQRKVQIESIFKFESIRHESIIKRKRLYLSQLTVFVTQDIINSELICR